MATRKISNGPTEGLTTTQSAHITDGTKGHGPALLGTENAESDDTGIAPPSAASRRTAIAITPGRMEGGQGRTVETVALIHIGDTNMTSVTRKINHGPVGIPGRIAMWTKRTPIPWTS